MIAHGLLGDVQQAEQLLPLYEDISKIYQFVSLITIKRYFIDTHKSMFFTSEENHHQRR